MQGLYVANQRPASKKAVKEAVAANPHDVVLEATSLFGNEFGGPVDMAPDGKYSFVGPDPYNHRKFYGTIDKSGSSIKVT